MYHMTCLQILVTAMPDMYNKTLNSNLPMANDKMVQILQESDFQTITTDFP